MESLTWIIPYWSPCAYFLLSCLFWPKMFCLFGAHTLLITSHAFLFSVRMLACFCSYESLSSHIPLSWGRPFSKPCATISEFTRGGRGVESFSGVYSVFYEKCCIKSSRYCMETHTLLCTYISICVPYPFAEKQKTHSLPTQLLSFPLILTSELQRALLCVCLCGYMWTPAFQLTKKDVTEKKTNTRGRDELKHPETKLMVIAWLYW